MKNKLSKEVERYISQFPAPTQQMLQALRQCILKTAPQAQEIISYKMPAYKINTVLVYFAGYKNHIGFYPTPNAILHFKGELKLYKNSKGAIQFPFNKPLPKTLIKKLVKFRVEEDANFELNKKVKDKHSNLNKDLMAYHNKLTEVKKSICVMLLQELNKRLPKAESKVWHGHPVWFINGNPIVGYSNQKRGIRLMFWSGASFNEHGLELSAGKFKDASVFYNSISEIHLKDLKRWLKKAEEIQWDYKNIVKRKGVLERIK